MGKIDWKNIQPVEGVELPYVPAATEGPGYVTTQYIAANVAGATQAQCEWGGFNWTPQRAISIRRIQLQTFFVNAAFTGREAIPGRVNMLAPAGTILIPGPLPNSVIVDPAGSSYSEQVSFGFGPSYPYIDFPEGFVIPNMPAASPILVTCIGYRNTFVINDRAEFYLQIQYKQL